MQQQPMYSRQEVGSYMRMFRENPRYFSREQGETLQKYATYYQIPHKKEEFDYTFSILDSIKQLGEGFLSGFTTLKIGEESLNPIENIFRSIGELAGFVGYIPAAPVSWAAKGIGLGAKALKIGKALSTVKKFENIAEAAKLTRSITSIPMAAANYVTGKAAGFATKTVAHFAEAGTSQALGTVTKFLTNNRTKHIINSAFHLGVASSVSNWQHGADQMMKSFVHGATTGAVFGAIGEVFQKGMLGVGEPIPLSALKGGKPIWSKISAPQKADVMMRMISSSVYTGLPATIRGATAPEQVYEYLLGSYFGYSGMNANTAEAQRFINEYSKEEAKPLQTDITRDPELNPVLKDKYTTLSTGAKKLVDQEIVTYYAHKEMPAFAAALVEADNRGYKGLAQDIVDVEHKISNAVKEAQVLAESGHIKDNLTTFQRSQKAFREVGIQLYTEIADKLAQQTINKNTTDAGYSIAFEPKNDSTIDFYDKFVLPKEIDFDKTNTEHVNGVTNIRNKWNELQPTGQKESRVDEFLDYLAKDHSLELTPEVKRYWRDKSNSRRFENKQQLIEYNMATGETYVLSGDRTGADDLLTLVRTDVPEEEIFNTYNKARYTGKEEYSNIKATRTFKHGVNTVKDTDRIVTIDKLSKMFLGQKEMANIFQSQLNEGFYPASGKNDKQEIKFLRFFPGVDTMPQKEVDILFGKINRFAGGAYTQLNKWAGETMSFGGRGITKEIDRRMTVSNAFYTMELNGWKAGEANIKTIMTGEGLINDPVNYNKRISIFDTAGIPVDSIIFNKELERPDGTMLKGIVVNTPVEKGGNTKDASELANKFGEQWDGRNIVTKRVADAINNTVGTPTDGNMIKSFIYHRDSKYGALLDKSATEVATPELEALMNKMGIDYILTDTTAKQSGSRKKANISYSTDGGWNIEGGEIFDIAPESVKVITGKKYDDHLTKPKRVAKQIFTNMITDMMIDKNFKSLKDKDLIKANKIANDIYNELVVTSKVGEEYYNELLNSYLSSPKKDAKVLQELLDNHSRIGLKELTETLRNPDAMEFNKKFLDIVVNINGQDDLDLAVEQGAIDNDINSYLQEGQTSKTSIDRYLENGGSYNHKFANRGKLNTALTSYVVKRITRPTVANSFEAVIGIYDLEAQNTYAKNLMDKDNIFYLGTNFKNMKLRSKVLAEALSKKGNTITLGEAYANYNKYNQAQKDAYLELTTALASRVPIDSMSGSQKLFFAGFTNKNDYGILLHPRTMQLLGGADSDADTAHIYFGGDGGFKAEWKDLIHSQKYEHGRMVDRVNPKVIFVNDEIFSQKQKDRVVAAQTDYKNNIIKLNRKTLMQNYKDKAWTKMKVAGVNPIPENKFKTYKEFEQFVIKHEQAHFLPEVKAIKNLAARENLANKIALESKNVNQYLEISVENRDNKYTQELLKPSKGSNDPLERLKDKNTHLSSFMRLEASKRSYETRELLATAVTNKAVIGATYAEMINSGKKEYLIDTELYDTIMQANGKPTQAKLWIRQTPKERSDYNMKEFKGFSTEAVRLSVDPSRPEEMISGNELFAKTVKKLFNFEYYIGDADGKPINAPEGMLEKLKGEAKPGVYRKGATKFLADVNRALFSKDYANKRPFSEMERKVMMSEAETIVGTNPVTFLGKFSKSLKDLEWQSDYLTHLSRESYTELFTKYNKDVREGRLKGANSLTKETFRPSEFSLLLMDLDIGNHRNKLALIEGTNPSLTSELFNSGAYKAMIKGLKEPSGVGKNADKPKISPIVETKQGFDRLSRVEKAIQIDKILRLGNDLITNDINLVSQMYNINSMMNDFNVSPARVREMIGYTQTNIKDLFSKLRGMENQRFRYNIDSDVTYGAVEILNNEAIKFKKTLTPEESVIFDQIMLSPLATGDKLTHGRLPLELPSTSNNAIRIMNEKMNGIFAELQKFDKRGVNSLSPESIEKASNWIYATVKEANTKSEGFAFVNPVLINGEIKVEGQQLLSEMKFLASQKKGVLRTDVQKVADETRDLIKDVPALNLQTLPGVFKHITGGKDMKYASLADWKAFNNSIKDIAYASDNAKLGKWWTYVFPQNISRTLLKHGLRFETEKVPYMDAEGNINSHGYALKPVEAIGYIQETIRNSDGFAEALRQKSGQMMDDDIRPFKNAVGDEISLELWKASTGIVEFPTVDGGAMTKAQKIPYIKNMAYAREVLAKYGAQKFKVTFGNNKTVTMSGKEIVNNFVEMQKKYQVVSQYLTHGNPESLEQYQVKEYLKKGNHMIESAPVWYKNNQKNYYNLIEKGYVPYGKPLKHAATGETVYDYIKYTRNYTEASTVLKELPNLEIGLDGRRAILGSMLKTVFATDPNKLEKLNKMIVEPTHVREHFVPHTFPEQDVVKDHIKKTIETIDKDANLTVKEKKDNIQSLMSRFGLARNDVSVKSFEDQLLDVMDNPGRKTLNQYQVSWLENNRKLGHMYGRTTHMPGWDTSPQTWVDHFSNISRNLYKLDAQMASHARIYQFYSDNVPKLGDKLATQHVDFYKMYTQGAMGFSVTVPQAVRDNPEMQVKGTLMDRLANDNVAAAFTKVGRKLKLLATPETKTDAKGVTKELRERLKKYEFSEKDMMWISNMEAKYELASLLSHPKTYVTNIYGGEINNFVNAGFNNLRDARSINYLMSVNPDWKNMEEVQKFVNGLGVIEEFIIHQIGLNPNLRKGRFNNFSKEVIAKLRKDPMMSDKNLLDIANKYQISESVLDKAAWFMRKSERILRRDSFMSHYVQSYKNWGSRLPYDHPYLIKQGLEGVKATQFLYSAPYKPMFANTAMGKILTRFQLWAWNNVRLKKDIISDAHKYGFRQGTESYNRFQRMATADIFALGLANAFMYSIFESALPAPWNWVQDFSDWIFGDDRERDKAFFGTYPRAVAPLQMLTPPAFRMVPPVMKAMIRNDFSVISDYHIWTMFPFGRIGRDIFGNGNIIENPYQIIEKTTGIPYREMSRQLLENRKTEPFVGL